MRGMLRFSYRPGMKSNIIAVTPWASTLTLPKRDMNPWAFTDSSNLLSADEACLVCNEALRSLLRRARISGVWALRHRY
jgi:hypothetical protein